MRSPITWFGGKGPLVKLLLELMPPHRFYVEPFGGSAALLFAKPPAEVETYNDIDEGVVNLFHVLRDPDQFREFKRLCSFTLYSRAEYNEARRTWVSERDPVRRAWKWFVVNRMSFGGQFGSSFGTTITTSSANMACECHKWLAAKKRLDAARRRLERVQIECADWRVILKRYCGEGYLCYCDPPYVHSTRKRERYKHELTDDDHEELVEKLLEYDGMVMLSGYRNAIYERLEREGWTRHDKETSCHVAGRTRATGILGEGAAKRMQPRVESVWLNPAAQRAGENDLLSGAKHKPSEV